MAFPVASGVTTPPIYPAGSAGNGLSGSGYIPEIWSGKLIEKFYASTVLAAISNTDYEGEIKGHGDKVHIRTKPTITIRPYLADAALELERPQGNQVILNIDQGQYFNTILDDVMKVQSDINLRDLELNVTSQVRDAARQLNANGKRVDATKAARVLAERRLEAEEKKFAAGMSTSFEVFQAQRDLAQARSNELRAVLDYDISQVNFETVQIAPTNGATSFAGSQPTTLGGATSSVISGGASGTTTGP